MTAKEKSSVPEAESKQSGRASIRLLGFLLLVGLGSGAAFLICRRPAPIQQPQASVAESQAPAPANVSRANEEPEARSETPPLSAVTGPSLLAPRSSPPLQAPAPAAHGLVSVPLPEPTAYTRQLVTGLARQDQPSGPLTPEAAAEWKANMQSLIQQGATGVAAIREFMQKSVDLDFGQAGQQLLGYSSARYAMFDALQQIGGPEALGVLLETMQTTAVPREIAYLAKNLEQQVPEQYQGDVLNAVRETLNMASAKNLGDADVGPLFEVLQRYGRASAIGDLEQAAGQWKYYATMTLAQLPDGAGVPSLIRMAQDPNSGAKSAALEMLAQVATQYPDARAALVQQVRSDSIAPRMWPYLVSPLAGDQLQVQDSVLAGAANVVPSSDVKTTHIAFGNQNFISAPNPSGLTSDQIAQQTALIDELLRVTSNPEAIKALQDAKALLARRQPQTAALNPDR